MRHLGWLHNGLANSANETVLAGSSSERTICHKLAGHQLSLTGTVFIEVDVSLAITSKRYTVANLQSAELTR